MCLQDPSNPTHDLGRQAKLIKHVQAGLVEANRRINDAMANWDSTDWTHPNSEAKKRFAMLDWCLGGDYDIFEHEREHLKEVGKRSRHLNTEERSEAEVTVAAYL